MSGIASPSFTASRSEAISLSLQSSISLCQRQNITCLKGKYHYRAKVMSFSDIFCCAESDICWRKRNCGCTAVILPALRAVPITASRSEAIARSHERRLRMCDMVYWSHAFCWPPPYHDGKSFFTFPLLRATGERNFHIQLSTSNIQHRCSLRAHHIPHKLLFAR